MKSQLVTVLSVCGVLVASGGAMAVNAQAFSSVSQSPLGHASEVLVPASTHSLHDESATEDPSPSPSPSHSESETEDSNEPGEHSSSPTPTPAPSSTSNHGGDDNGGDSGGDNSGSGGGGGDNSGPGGGGHSGHGGGDD